MNIYTSQGELLINQVSDSSYRDRKVMGQHNLTIEVKSPTPINFSVGCYLDYQGIRYTIRKKSAIVKHGTRHLEYTVTFESPQADAEKRTVRNRVDNRLKFPYTATPKEHAELIVWNLNQIGGGWQVGECIEAPHALVSYNHTKCWDAVKTIADTFNTEFEFDCYNKKLHLRKVEYNKDNPLSLAYGMGNGFKTGIRRDNVDSRVAIEILAVQAGSRNIDASKNDNHPELLLPKNQTIAFDGSKFEDQEGFDAANAKTYKVDAEGLTIQRADKELVTYEDSSTDLSNIYPMRIGTVTDVHVDDKGNYDIFDSTIPENLDYSQYRIDGERMTMIFQKSAMLAGREFDLLQTENRVTGYKHGERKFMIVSQEYDGQMMPNETFVPTIGDTYAIFGMMMPDEYIREDVSKSGASWDMFREAVKILYEEEQEKFLFDGKLDGIWAKKDWLNIGGKIVLGGYIRFTDDQIIESGEDNVLIRITGIRDYLNNPYSPEITLANVTAATYNEEFRKIDENEVVAEHNNNNTVNFVKRTWKGAMELINNIYDPSGSFQNDLLSAVAIRSMVGTFGDELLQYVFLNTYWDQEIEPQIIYNTQTHRIECESANIKHMTLGIDTLQPDRHRTEYLYWKIPAYNSAVLVDNPSQFYYLYLRVSKTYTPDEDGLKKGTGEFFISPTKVEFDSEPDNYILLVAFINSEEVGNRQITPLYGFAELTPGMLRINNIVSNDGNSFLRLLANQFKIGDTDRYLAWNVIAGLLEIVNATLEMRNSEDEVVSKIDGDTGAAMFGKGSHLFNADGSLSLANENILWDIINGLVLSGKFESNKDGIRFVIDPVDRSFNMMEDDTNIVKLKLYNVGGTLSPSLTFDYTPDSTIGRLYTLLRSGEISFSGRDFNSVFKNNGFTITDNDSTSLNDQVAYMILDAAGELRVKLDKLPTDPIGLERGRIWRDGTYLRIIE